MKRNQSDNQWQSIVSIARENRKSLRHLLTDDAKRIRFQFFSVYLIFTVVSLGMTVVNYFTHWHMLMYATLCFAAVNAINVALCLIGRGPERAAYWLFGIETFLLFLFFVVVGEPEGFSAIWIVLLPTCGLLLYQLKYGIPMAIAELLLLIFLFWTRPGNALLRFQYTRSFMLRFPMLYIAFLSVGAFFEYVRSSTQKELVETRAKFRFLSNHDALTGLYNRFGFNELLDDHFREESDKGFALAILDLDDFKRINDRYGHSNGDVVLTRCAHVITDCVGEAGDVCRWGGEEFAVCFSDPDAAEQICEQILQGIRSQTFNFYGNPCSITVSIGLTLMDRGSSVTAKDLVILTDKSLYKAKGKHKNCLVTDRA